MAVFLYRKTELASENTRFFIALMLWFQMWSTLLLTSPVCFKATQRFKNESPIHIVVATWDMHVRNGVLVFLFCLFKFKKRYNEKCYRNQTFPRKEFWLSFSSIISSFEYNMPTFYCGQQILTLMDTDKFLKVSQRNGSFDCFWNARLNELLIKLESLWCFLIYVMSLLSASVESKVLFYGLGAKWRCFKNITHLATICLLFDERINLSFKRTQQVLWTLMWWSEQLNGLVWNMSSYLF